jgi:hypothetical protein
MYTWFRKVPRALTLAGRAEAANTLFTASTSLKMSFSAFAISAPPLPELTAKYLPLPTFAMLLSSAVCPGPWPLVPGLTSTV